MTMIHIPNETPAEREERLAQTRERAAHWEAVIRSLPILPKPKPAPKPAPKSEE